MGKGNRNVHRPTLPDSPPAVDAGQRTLVHGDFVLPLSEEGAPLSFDEKPMAPGVLGYALQRPDGSVWIPDIRAIKKGSGDVGRFLTELPVEWHIVVPNVVSKLLGEMLARRGFEMGVDEEGCVMFERKPVK